MWASGYENIQICVQERVQARGRWWASSMITLLYQSLRQAHSIRELADMGSLASSLH